MYKTNLNAVPYKRKWPWIKIKGHSRFSLSWIYDNIVEHSWKYSDLSASTRELLRAVLEDTENVHPVYIAHHQSKHKEKYEFFLPLLNPLYFVCVYYFPINFLCSSYRYSSSCILTTVRWTSSSGIKNWLILSYTPLPLYCRLKNSFCMPYTFSTARSFVWRTCRLFCWCWIISHLSTVCKSVPR